MKYKLTSDLKGFLLANCIPDWLKVWRSIAESNRFGRAILQRVRMPTSGGNPNNEKGDISEKTDRLSCW